jgi:hydroxyethylthiazole kinase-like uncharacterized protein yjeF
MLHPAALLTAEESREADQATIKSGVTGASLMEKAASAVAHLIREIYEPCPTLVICGPGNNGGDGKIVAQLLKDADWKADIATIESFTPAMLEGKQLVVDALFGTGLNKPIEGAAAKIVEAVNASNLSVIAIDIASGVNATDGSIMGAAVRATHTVTFVRPKAGQVLLPGKAYTGTLHVFDIGVDGASVTPTHFLNHPPLWKRALPIPGFDSYKYTRGHAIVVGGNIATTGATRLAALSALRVGAGLVSVTCTPETLPIYAVSLTAVMTKPAQDIAQLAMLLDDPRITAALIGPGSGLNENTREWARHVLSHKKPCVLDADALTAFKHNPSALFSAIKGPTVLTPHHGEFERLFSVEGTKPHRTREAAKHSKAVVVFKGNDTVIAAPDGRVAINANAPAWLATAGSGDVLAGLITGLLAQGMDPFDAACAGVWIQARAATAFGPGLIAEDLPNFIPDVLKELYGENG